jgi:hypothetical protein
MLIKQRTESARTAALNSKTITISCRVWHDFGTARNVTLQLYKCNAIDNWGALTSISTSAAVACASGAYTTVKHTITLGAADATNGFELVLQDTATATVTSKSFLVSEWKMEVGSVATPFQLDDALRRCQRYYEVMGGDNQGAISVYEYASAGGQNIVRTFAYKVMKWKTNPVATIVGTWSKENCTAFFGTFGTIGQGELRLAITSDVGSTITSAQNAGAGNYLTIDARL